MASALVDALGPEGRDIDRMAVPRALAGGCHRTDVGRSLVTRRTEAVVRCGYRARMPAVVIDEAIPGADLVDTGLADLAAGRESIEALLVLQASGRLRLLGYDVPEPAVASPEARMYELIVMQVGSRRAHGRYNALRRRLSSFIRAAPRAAIGR